MARLNFEQKIAINGQECSWPEKRAVEDWTWNRVKFYSFIFACLAAVVGLLLLGYWLGGSGCYTCTQNKPVAIATAGTTPASSTQATETATLTEIEKDLSAIGKILLEQKETAQASASATASATTMVVAPPPPKIERRVVVTKKADLPCPPESAKMPTVDQVAPPPSEPTLGFAERRRNEMWSALRR